tara:strand:- start:6767 stop:7525 length:759 start_codon:yes stop_codon:yes gene_type:complete
MKINKPTPFKYKKSPLKQNFDDLMREFGNLPTEAIEVGDYDRVTSAQAKDQEFSNFYKDIKNPYAEMNLENFAEDLTVNQQAAEFQKQQAQGQEANMLDAMRSGGGFNAGNIQAMAGASSQRAQAASADIGRQEQANQALKVQGAQDVQRRREMQAGGELQAASMVAGGATAAQQAKAQSSMQQAQMNQQANIANQAAQMQHLGMQYQSASDARNLEFQQKQGMLQLQSGKDAADAANEQANKNWGQKVGGW